MMSLSIISDFCSWWPFWWIAPFVLGILLGRSIWGSYKRKVRDLEDQLSRNRTEIHNLNSALKHCQAQREADNIRISDQQKELNIASKKLSLLATTTPVIATGISQSNAPMVPQAKEAKKPESSKGNYSILKKTNLQIIEGIGPKLESVLKENGVKKWGDLASRSYGELRAILDKYGGRYAIVDPSSWPKQATLAKREKWQKLIDLQAADGSKSKLKKILIKLEIL